jgi:hypothetical protein
MDKGDRTKGTGTSVPLNLKPIPRAPINGQECAIVAKIGGTETAGTEVPPRKSTRPPTGHKAKSPEPCEAGPCYLLAAQLPGYG